MTIISPLPFTLANGTTADATEVMANLNQIRNDVNSNAAGGGGSGNVVGPASAVDGHIAVFDGITGKIIRDGGAAPVSGAYRGAVVTKSGTQIPGAVASVSITFDSEIIDTDGIHSNVLNNTRLTVPAGITLVRLFASITATGVPASTDLSLTIVKTAPGSGVAAETQRIANGAFQTTMVTSAIVVTPGDYFELSLATVLFLTGITIQTGTKFEMQILG